jgi:hypothetical protein
VVVVYTTCKSLVEIKKRKDEKNIPGARDADASRAPVLVLVAVRPPRCPCFPRFDGGFGCVEVAICRRRWWWLISVNNN